MKIFKSHLLQALQDLPASEPHPEDVRIGLDHRARLERDHGLRFAPVDVATRFSYESGPHPGTPFGFHGIGAWADVLKAPEVDALVRTVPAQLLVVTWACTWHAASCGRARCTTCSSPTACSPAGFWRAK